MLALKKAFNSCERMLKWSRVPVHLEHVPPLRLSQSFSCRYIVDHFYDHSSDLLSTLYKFQRQGAVVLSRLRWCELVLSDFL